MRSTYAPARYPSSESTVWLALPVHTKNAPHDSSSSRDWGPKIRPRGKPDRKGGVAEQRPQELTTARYPTTSQSPQYGVCRKGKSAMRYPRTCFNNSGMQ